MTNGTVKDAFISINMEENENIFTPYPAEAGRHVSFLTGFEDEVMGAEHSFLEHECDKDLVGSHLDFATFNLRKCFSVENLTCPLEYDEMIDGDVVDSTLNIGDETKTEFFDGMLQETDDLLSDHKTLPLTSKLSLTDRGRSISSSFGCGPPNGHTNEKTNPCDGDGEKVGSENKSGDAGMEPGNMNSSTVFDLMSVKELQDTFRSMFGRETIVVDKQWLKRRIMFGMQNNKLNKDLNFMVCDMSSREMDGKVGPTSAEILNRSNTRPLDNECKPSLMSSTGTLAICNSFQVKVDEAGARVTGKRAHRPPKRFIEESSELKSSSSSSKIKRRRCAVSSPNNNTSKTKVKLVRVKHEKQLCIKETEESQSLCPEEPFDGACIQVPFGLPLEEEQHLKEKTCLTTTTAAIVPFVPCLDSDNSPSNQSTISNERSDPDCSSIKLIEEEEEEEYAPTDDYEYDEDLRPGIQKSSGGTPNRRRKHHMPWTQSEVMKLIDGVAHLGVGRWSKIKRLLFSSSKHRTSVDLKDKWRNLVKASSLLKKKRKQGCLVQVRKPMSHQAPEPVLRRVRELASHYSLMD